jgi:hypothetical protein
MTISAHDNGDGKYDYCDDWIDFGWDDESINQDYWHN